MDFRGLTQRTGTSERLLDNVEIGFYRTNHMVFAAQKELFCPMDPDAHLWTYPQPEQRTHRFLTDMRSKRPSGTIAIDLIIPPGS